MELEGFVSVKELEGLMLVKSNKVNSVNSHVNTKS